MTVDYELLIKEHRRYIEKVLKKDKLHIPLCILSGNMRKVKKEYLTHKPLERKENEFLYLANLSDKIDRNKIYRYLNKLLHTWQDILFERKYKNHKGKMKKAIIKSPSSYLSIVCIIKNEARYIEEWIAYYKWMGVDHIYLFNNGSTDNIKEVLQPYIESCYVTFLDYTGANAQLPLYRMMAKFLKKKSRWIAYIDADEFILPANSHLKEYLSTKEQYGAIGINWIVYGTGGHKNRPEGLVTENYWETFEDVDNLLNLRIKSIVNPEEIYDVASPHFCVLKNGCYAVDESGEEITTKWMYVAGSGPAFTGKNQTRDIRINHYWTKSEQDLSEKCNRGYAAGEFSPDYENIMKRLDYPKKTDRIMEVHIPKIKEFLQNKF